MIDVGKIRAQFPLLHQKVNGENLVYFDNGASTQKPQVVIDAIAQYYSNDNANIHRGVHYLSQKATDKFEETRDTVQAFINANKSCEIIFTKGTTDSINLVANGYRSMLNKGDDIIISEMEHHSNIVPWQMCCEVSGATLKVIPILDNGDLDMDAFENLLSEKTKLVAVTHISNALGTINPVEKLIALTHKVGAKILIDGAQATPHALVDVQGLDVDFYCFSAHKMYGPTGVGVLYGKEALLNELPPYQGGGEMIKEVSFEKTTYADLPHKFEAGTPNIAGVIAFKAAMDFITDLGISTIAKHEDTLVQYATKQLLTISGMQFIGEAKKRAALVSFNIESLHPYDIGVLLDKMGIAIRTGHHCAQPIMEHYKVPGTARMSFAIYNTKEEIDSCITAIKKAQTMLA
ncbi:MAG TPA: cysteine desulfurase [Flavobacteriales bacterium]|nr:cysteine desulfurase [Flavobacteriales bacterium]HIL66908.1 cysteine desulfurase [Flavobacteriales bacterium]